MDDPGESAYIMTMGAERDIFEQRDEQAEAEADARAEADVQAGRLISHDAVRRWLSSLDPRRPSPRPRAGD